MLFTWLICATFIWCCGCSHTPSKIVGCRAFYFAALLQNAEYFIWKNLLKQQKRTVCFDIFILDFVWTNSWLCCHYSIFLLSDMFLKHPNVEDLRILRIYSKSIETKSYYGPHSNKVYYSDCIPYCLLFNTYTHRCLRNLVLIKSVVRIMSDMHCIR